jgi:hypothetical protein
MHGRRALHLPRKTIIDYKENKMKTRILYLIWIVTMLLSACSSGSVALKQSVEASATQAVEISPTATPDQ